MYVQDVLHDSYLTNESIFAFCTNHDIKSYENEFESLNHKGFKTLSVIFTRVHSDGFLNWSGVQLRCTVAYIISMKTSTKLAVTCCCPPGGGFNRNGANAHSSFETRICLLVNVAFLPTNQVSPILFLLSVT